MMSDDHTSQAWGIYGGVLEKYAINKNIKRLAVEGVVLENAFCTNSICVPSRASILTGQYSHKNQVYTLTDALEPDKLNVAKILRSSGYQTALVGKWHLKKQPSGFDYFNVLPGQGRYNNPLLKDIHNWEDGNKGGKVFEGFSSDVIMDESIKWLDQRDKDKPFMLMTHFKATHEPFDYPDRFKNLFNGETLPEPESLLDFYPGKSGRTFEGQILEILTERWTKATQTKSNRYPGLPFDTVGLDSIQIRKKTYQKFVIKYPNEIPAGKRIDDIILNIDFPSLILDYAGVPQPDSFQGKSFRSNLMLETPSDWRNNMYYRYYAHAENRPSHMGIRTNQHKLIFYYGHPLGLKGTYTKKTTPPAWEYYDLENDPMELSNQYNNIENKKIISQLKIDLLNLRTDLGDEKTDSDELKEIFENHWE